MTTLRAEIADLAVRFERVATDPRHPLSRDAEYALGLAARDLRRALERPRRVKQPPKTEERRSG